MPRPSLPVKALLDGAEILSWTPRMLRVCVQQRLLLEIEDLHGVLVVRNTRVRFENSHLKAPGHDIDTKEIVLLNRADPIWQDTAAATLDQARRVMQAHSQLLTLYPDLVLSEILQHHPDVVISPDNRPYLEYRDVSCCYAADMMTHTGSSRHVSLSDARFVQATQNLSCVDDGRWVMIRQHPRPQFPSLPTAHAKMAYRASLGTRVQDFYEHVLPVIVS